MKTQLTERSARLRQTLNVFDFGEVSTKSAYAFQASARSQRSLSEVGLKERSRKRKVCVCLSTSLRVSRRSPEQSRGKFDPPPLLNMQTQKKWWGV